MLSGTNVLGNTKQFSAGDTQGHFTRNAFNILANEGFLWGQGILNLEAVQEFYKMIEEEPRKATMKVANLLDFCDQMGFNKLDFTPVITLTKIISRTGESLGHAVVLNDYTRYEDALYVKAFDSATESGERYIQCPIITESGRQKLNVCDSKDKWCLGSETCYFFEFNWSTKSKFQPFDSVNNSNFANQLHFLHA